MIDRTTTSGKLMVRLDAFKPNYAKAYCNLGAVYAQMGRYSKAVSAFKEAVRLNPDDRVAQQNLERAYEKVEDRGLNRLD